MRLCRATAGDLDGLDEVFARAREEMLAYLPRLAHTRGGPGLPAQPRRDDRGLGRRRRRACRRVRLARRRPARTHLRAPARARGRLGSAGEGEGATPRRLPPLGLPAERGRATLLRAPRAPARRAHRRRGQRAAPARCALRVAAV